MSQTIEQLAGSAVSVCLRGRRVSCRLELHKAGGRTSAKLRLGLQADKTRIKQHEGHSLLWRWDMPDHCPGGKPPRMPTKRFGGG